MSRPTTNRAEHARYALVLELYKKQLGDVIRARREELGLTQTKLAELVPVKESTTVSRWERGERVPNDLDAVARALQTTAAKILAQLDPINQKERRRLQPGGGTQLDRIEAAVNGILRLLEAAGPPKPEGELGRRLATVDPNPSDRPRRRTRKATDSGQGTPQ
jgi:transcriptional regulator with XRE-family HTH domain